MLGTRSSGGGPRHALLRGGGLRSALLCSVARLLGLRRDRHRRHRKRGERGGDLADNADAVGHEDSLLVAGAGDGFPPEERIRAIWLNHC